MGRLSDILDHCNEVLQEDQKPDIDVTGLINTIENDVYKILKPYGFRKHGRTFHRFVSGDISQVISFQCGQVYREETHLMWVNTGIRVPESCERCFEYKELKKYYREAECNIRSRLGVIHSRDVKKIKTFDLRGDISKITNEIIDEIIQDVMPVFEVLCDRQTILDHRREYPWFDIVCAHSILLDEAMIHGHLGDMDKAKELFERHYKQACKENINPDHIEYLDKLAEELGIR